MSGERVFFGESECQARYGSGEKKGEKCSRKAYYKVGSQYFCGTHSGANRTKLPKNPQAGKEKEESLHKHQESVKTAQMKNKAEGKLGDVMCSKLGMMKAPVYCNGFLNVFPNFKHQNRKDGFGCASLSPMSLGPVDHGQKGLPPAKCLENFHQFNKVFQHEVENGKTTSKFRTVQLQGYNSKEPKRHKYNDHSGSNKRKSPGQGPSRPLFSVYYDVDGSERKYTWVQSRYFYCHFYEQLVQTQEDYKILWAKKNDGINLNISGYDGITVNTSLEEMYNATTQPFGHELVLYTMLTVSDPSQYPWNQYYMKHKKIYPDHLRPKYLQDNMAENKQLKPNSSASDMGDNQAT